MAHRPNRIDREAYTYWVMVKVIRFNIRCGAPFDRQNMVDELDALASTSGWPLIRERYRETRAALQQLSLAYQA